MRSRLRRLAALLALLTLSLFQAEAVWASMCEMGMEADAPARMADPASHADPGTPMDGPGRSHGKDGPGSPPDCPLIPGGQTSCVGAVALPAVTGSAPEVPPVGALPIRSPQHARDLLLAAALLRPPRA